MPYPVLPPAPPPVVDVVPSEGDTPRVSPPAIAPDSTTQATPSVAPVPLPVQPSVVAPEIIQEYREAVPLDAIDTPVRSSEDLGLPLEATISVQAAIQQATDPVAEQALTVGVAPSAFLDSLPSPTISRSSVTPTPSPSQNSLQASGAQASTPPASVVYEAIPELEAVSPEALDPTQLGVTPAPALAALSPSLSTEPGGEYTSTDPAGLEAAKAEWLDPFGDRTEQSLAALVPLLEGLEAHVRELHAVSEESDRLLGQLNETDLSSPFEELPSPIPVQPSPPAPSGTPSTLPDVDVGAPTIPPEALPGLPDESLQDEIGEPLPERPTLEIPTPDTPLDPNSVDPSPSPTESPDAPADPATNPTGVGETVEVIADYQEYDQFRQVFVAEGNVEVRFQDSILQADRVVVNLPNRVALAEGDAALLANQQLIYGDRLQYDFVRQEGSVEQARGEIVLSPLRQADAPTLPAQEPNLPADALRLRTPQDRPPGDILLERQPPQATATGQNLDFGIGVGETSIQLPTGEVRRLRFEADRVDFFPEGWEATNLRLTNDPFSPPELELRTSSARLTRISPTQQELIAQNPRLVFDQGLSIPLIRERYVFGESEQRNAFFIGVGFDEDDRGGLFIERAFQILDRPDAFIQLTPQFYVQRMIDEGFDASSFGVEADAEFRLTPTTTLFAEVELTSFDFADDEFEDTIRSSTRLAQRIGDHTLSFFHSYREDIFNGSLGNQEVRNSFGAVLTSPTYTLGDSGIRLSYQAGIQSINANIASDVRDEILGPPPRDNSRGTLTRYQIGARLQRSFLLWEGEPLPATPTEGLRYTPEPVVPFLSLDTSVLGVASFYSSGDTQPILTTTVGLSGQIGHFSRPAFDYLGFNIAFSYTPDGPESPFNFDREDDRQVLSGGLTAQLFGPVRAGFQTAYNVETGEEINTTFFLQYTRRTYSIDVRYSPTRELGSLNFSINDFNWTGETTPFDGSDYEPRYPDR